MLFPQGLLGKEHHCSLVTLFALDNLSAHWKDITTAGDDSNKDGLKHAPAAAEERLFALCLNLLLPLHRKKNSLSTVNAFAPVSPPLQRRFNRLHSNTAT